MKLIVESSYELNPLVQEEINEATGKTQKNYYLEGICSTPEKKNRNGRVYPRHIWEREVELYQKEIENNTINTLGEWQHPPRSDVDPMKAVIRITELKFKDDGNVWVKAKILNDNSDITNKLKALIDEGMKIGISTRGVGRVGSNGIVEEYKLITADLVDMPSDYNANLNGIVEGYTYENGIMLDKDYDIDENGCIGEVCGLNEKDNTSNTTEKCPIQEKIDIAIETLYNKIKEETQQNLKTIEESIYKNTSEYLSECGIGIVENKSTKDEKNDKNDLKESLIKLADMLK